MLRILKRVGAVFLTVLLFFYNFICTYLIVTVINPTIHTGKNINLIIAGEDQNKIEISNPCQLTAESNREFLVLQDDNTYQTIRDNSLIPRFKLEQSLNNGIITVKTLANTVLMFNSNENIVITQYNSQKSIVEQILFTGFIVLVLNILLLSLLVSTFVKTIKPKNRQFKLFRPIIITDFRLS